MKNKLSASAVHRWLTLFILFALLNCAPDEICFTDHGTQIQIDFKRVTYPGTDSAFVERDTLIFFQVSALETDSIFIAQDTLSSIVVPVNTGKNQTIIVFDTDRGTHQLELSYHRSQRLISAVCGPEQIINTLETGTTSFDSAVVIQPALIEPADSNVEVYN